MDFQCIGETMIELRKRSAFDLIKLMTKSNKNKITLTTLIVVSIVAIYSFDISYALTDDKSNLIVVNEAELKTTKPSNDDQLIKNTLPIGAIVTSIILIIFVFYINRDKMFGDKKKNRKK